MEGKHLDQIPHDDVQEIVQDARETLETFEMYTDGSIEKATLDGETTQLEIKIKTEDARHLQKILHQAQKLGLIATMMRTGRATDNAVIRLRKNL